MGVSTSSTWTVEIDFDHHIATSDEAEHVLLTMLEACHKHGCLPISAGALSEPFLVLNLTFDTLDKAEFVATQAKTAFDEFKRWKVNLGHFQ